MAIVRTDGGVYELDTATWKFSPTPSRAPGQEWNVAHAEWPRAGGSKLYLGYGGVGANGMSAANELRVIDTAKWVESGRVQTSVPFWSAAVSQAGKTVYAVAPERHGIVVLDADTLQETGVIAVGNTPSLAFVAPGFTRRQAGRD